MSIELVTFIVMLSVFLIGYFLFKIPVSISMVISSVLGAIVAGEGIPIRHLFEGTFVYIDTFLIISTAMIFMDSVEKSGAMESLTASIVKTFHSKPAVLLILLMFIIMFPGMITGSSTAAVLSSGAIVAKILLLIGIPASQVGAIIAIGAIMGMAAPPVNIPAMLISGGVDMPYIGFEGPLLFLTIPGAIFTVLFIGYKFTKQINYESILGSLNFEVSRKYGFKIYLPIVVLIVLMLITRIFPNYVPNLGMPLIFLISSIVSIFTGEKYKFLVTIKDSMKKTIPVLGKLIGVGMFIQIMTLTGVRGLIVINSLGLNEILLYIAIATIMPAFGAVSSYGAASVLGVPFLLALITKNQIITAAALSFICSLGDLMPPTALAGNYAAQLVGEKYSRVLRYCIIPFIILVIFGILTIVYANNLTLII